MFSVLVPLPHYTGKEPPGLLMPGRPDAKHLMTVQGQHRASWTRGPQPDHGACDWGRSSSWERWP